MSDARPLVFALVEQPSDRALVELGREVGDVVALSASGTDGEAEALRLLEATGAMGATRAVLVSDAVLATVDYLAIAHVLACAVRHLCETRPEAPIIVLAGDRGRCAVGPAVAERLAVPHLAAVRAFGLRSGSLVIDRLCGAELRRYVGAPPIVLCCALPKEGPTSAVESSARPERLSLETLRITPPELQYRQRFRPIPGAGPRSRPHLVANIEHLGDRLSRDGLWPVPREEA